MSFNEFQLKSFINKAIDDLNFKEPKPIQKEIIPRMLQNKNVIGQSETGSGKTHAFLLPLFNKTKPEGHVQAVITSPTRELAKQIYEMALHISRFSPTPYKIKCYVGGTDREKDLDWLERNQPDIVIGTPGRIWDYAVKESKLLIHETKLFIIDEADMTLETGFLKEVDNIAGLMPENLQMCVFSATIPEGLKPFLNKYMERPEFINLVKENKTPTQLTHYLIKSYGKDKFRLLLRLLNNLNPYLAIIFGNTKVEVSEIKTFLLKNNYKVGEIHGDLSSRERARMMRNIRDLKYTYVVATDIASRGIDIEGVSHIINFSLPNDEEFYIHRSGRSSRNNLTGVVYSFYDFDNNEYLNKLESKNITFKEINLKEDDIVEVKKRNRRKQFMKKVINKKPKIVTPKPKKVKPNYKKKMKNKQRNRK